MTFLADLLSVGFVARHAGFDIVFRLEGMPAAVARNVVDKTRNMRSREHHVIVMAIVAELTIRVTRLAVALECLCVKSVRVGVVQRVTEPVEVIAFVTILTVVHAMARLTRLVTVDRGIRARQIGVGVYEVGAMADGHEIFSRGVARTALDIGYCVLIVTINAFHHSGQNAHGRDLSLLHTGMAIFAG